MSFCKRFFWSVYWLLFKIILCPKVTPGTIWSGRYIYLLEKKTGLGFPPMTRCYRSPRSGPGGPRPRSRDGANLVRTAGLRRWRACRCWYLVALLSAFSAVTEGGSDARSPAGETCHAWCTWVARGLEGKLGSPPLLLSSLSPSLVLEPRSGKSQGTCVLGGYLALKWGQTWTEGQFGL